MEQLQVKAQARKGKNNGNVEISDQRPICGMIVDESTALHAERDRKTSYFYSDHRLRHHASLQRHCAGAFGRADRGHGHRPAGVHAGRRKS
jgi:YHS domain-containing protein